MKCPRALLQLHLGGNWRNGVHVESSIVSRFVFASMQMMTVSPFEWNSLGRFAQTGRTSTRQIATRPRSSAIFSSSKPSQALPSSAASALPTLCGE